MPVQNDQILDTTKLYLEECDYDWIASRVMVGNPEDEKKESYMDSRGLQRLRLVVWLEENAI